jgi:chromosomal replication initiation ATPase DnaA
MEENQNIPITAFQRLQQALEKVVNKVGVQKTTELLESFDHNSSITANEMGKVKLIKAYVVSHAIRIFSLEESDFYTSEIREYREARMACYYIIHTYTKCSYAKIGELFGKKKRTILYYCQKCKGMVEEPLFDREFAENYRQLDKCTIKFIGKIN